MDDRYPDFPHHAEIYEYLNDYVDTFGLREVAAAQRLPGGGWELQAGGESHRFDVFVVGSGDPEKQTPHWPMRAVGCAPSSGSRETTTSQRLDSASSNAVTAALPRRERGENK